jgi:hypothetical protein
MESNQTQAANAGMKIGDSTLEELARDFFTAMDAGKMPRERALTLLLEIVYLNAVRNTAAEWFDLKAKARMREQMEEQKARMDAATAFDGEQVN